MINYDKDYWKEPCPKVDCRSKQCKCGLKTVNIPAALGNDGEDSKYAPKNGAYCNAIVKYEANGHLYVYDAQGIPTYIESGSGGVDSFDLLNGRPKYDGQQMTSWTNIPEVPTAVSQLTNDSNYQTASDVENSISAATGPIVLAVNAEAEARGNADTALGNRLTAVEGIAATALQPTDINKTVVSDVALDANPSTTSVQLEEGKVNLMSGTTSTETIALPVASSTQAGVMNSATYDAITDNANNINALMNGAVAVTGMSASPSQSDITSAWESETGLSTLINRASVYDVTNNKVWTYYTNDTTWHEASNTTQVSVGTFTNGSEGTIKGSTVAGQVFAENNGTGSVNGWDNLVNNVSTNTSKLATIAQGAEVNVQSDWDETSTISDAYIKNKPTVPTKTSQLTNDSNFVNQTSLNSKLTTANLTASDGITKTTSGSGASTAVALSLADSGVTSAKIASSAVTSAKIGSSAVTSAKIASSAVTTAKIADNAVTASKIDFSTIGPLVVVKRGVSPNISVTVTPKVSGGLFEIEGLTNQTKPVASTSAFLTVVQSGGALTRGASLSGGTRDSSYGAQVTLRTFFSGAVAGTSYTFTLSLNNGSSNTEMMLIARYYPGS